MAKPGTFQPGNQLSAKGRRVERILERACLQDDDRRLREGVEKVLDLFAEGDKWAVEYVTDRLDGKARQSMDLTAKVGLLDLGVLADQLPDNDA